eukprot:Hpha_TRINITY_DN11845_c0_g1::TRINITY_DN11845_c0_g1_i1::g.1837::m.1837
MLCGIAEPAGSRLVFGGRRAAFVARHRAAQQQRRWGGSQLSQSDQSTIDVLAERQAAAFDQQRELLGILREEIARLREQTGDQGESIQRLEKQVKKQVKTSCYATGASDAQVDAEMEDAAQAACDSDWPNLAIADAQPRQYKELSNEALATLAAQGQRGMHAAHRERLIREIMRVDRCPWETAFKKLGEMDAANERIYWALTGPHRIGICVGVGCGFASLPMVFSKPVAVWFALNFVGETELPDDLDEMTPFQVGAWTWDWMEPILGTASFVLLAAQFVRSLIKRMNTKPYTELVLSYRADRLSRLYPKYDRTIVRDWARYLPRVGIGFFPEYESRDSRPFSGI